jgi:uncharacterized SAM-binding protein YcdF (DUF218 family)
VVINALPVLFFALLCIGIRRDRRRFSNAVYFGLTALLTLLIVGRQVVSGAGGPTVPFGRWLLLALVLPAVLAGLILPFFLIANGVKMIRKEGRRPANLLSFLTGLGIFALIGLTVVAMLSDSRLLLLVTGTLLPVVGYVSFLFFCFIGYAFLYGRVRPRRDVDFVVVLGSGLIGGNRVPPLLASRLDQAHALHDKQAEGGKPPVLVASGGRGSDERISESRAMADYLIGRGLPADHVLLEDRSRTTEENLRFSRGIMEQAHADYSCVIVTNNFHAFRAALTARTMGVNGQVVGSPTAAYFWPSATLREFAAVFLAHRRINFAICGGLIALGVLTFLAV